MARKTPIHWAWWLLAIALLLAWQYLPRDAPQTTAPQVASSPASSGAPASVEAPAPPPRQTVPDAGLPAFLPAEAHHTISMIQHGGPFPHRQDGSVFGNREGHLPQKQRGWYREYTVDTPGLSHRGARRIVTGGNPPRDWYYTSDHYDTFRAFDPGPTNGALQ